MPWRWVVERTFGWLGRCRIHSKDIEHLTDSSEAQIRISMIQLMLRRLTGAKYRDRFRYKRPRRRTTAQAFEQTLTAGYASTDVCPALSRPVNLRAL